MKTNKSNFMLHQKLLNIKLLLEKELYLNDEDKELLSVLSIIDSDPDIQRILNLKTQKKFSKSFALAPDYCPTCGKRL